MDLVFLIKLESPLLITSRYTRAGPEVLLDRIPGSSIGGAFAKCLETLLGVSVARIHEYVVRGEYVFSDAYPVLIDESKPKLAMPAPPICIEVKTPKLFGLKASILCPLEHVIDATPQDFPSRMLEALKFVEDYLISKGIPHVGLTKQVVGTPIVIESVERVSDRNLVLAKGVDVAKELGVETRDSVTINPWLRRGEEGMLYSYEGIASGTLWWGVARLPNDIAEKVVDQVVEIRIGRAKTRGFGIAKIVLRELKNELRGDSAWYLVWSPLPISRKIRAYAPRERALMWIHSWSQNLDIARASVLALKPGSIVWIESSTASEGEPYRLTGFVPPWGSIERIERRSLQPPSLIEASKLVPDMIRRLG